MTDRQLTLRISLKGVEPPIWRTFVLGSNHSLLELHWVAQAFMGWEDCHQHEFVHGKRRIGSSEPHPEAEHGAVEEEVVTLGELFSRKGSNLTYVYDFGDEWTHEIRLECAEPLKDGEGFPTCLDGARACPPEDSGGVHGYQDKLRALADPKDDDDRDMAEWLGDGFDPEAFSAEEANERLKRLFDDDGDFDDDDASDDDDVFDDDSDDEIFGWLGLSYDPLIAPEPDRWLRASESVRLEAAEEYHLAMPARQQPPNLPIHAAVHAIVENQLAANDPPQTGEAMVRLLKDGLDRHDAIHAIGSVVAGQMFQAIRFGEDPNADLVPQLEGLTAASWLAQHNAELRPLASRGSASSTKKRGRRKKKSKSKNKKKRKK